jgi:quercetin dioxygenase-like cupin family protein
MPVDMDLPLDAMPTTRRRSIIMAKVKISDVDQAQWIRSIDMATPELAKTLEPDEANTLVHIHAEGSEKLLQLFEVKLPGHAKQRIHAHDHDEIIYVVAGEMRVGNRKLKPGSSMFIAGETFYSFEAGPEGLHFLNFRPCKDISYILPENAKPAA